MIKVTPNKWTKRVVGGLVFLLLAGFLFFPLPTLVISSLNGKTVLVIPLQYEKQFTYEYIHSVQKTPVQEHFVLAPDDVLLLTSTHYRSLGVGLPFLPEEGQFVNDNGVFVINGMNREFEKITMGFMPIAHQALFYHDKRYNLKDYFKPGAFLEIRARHLSPAEIIWQSWLARGEVNSDQEA